MTLFTFCLFVNIEIKTFGWHIQNSGVVLKTIFDVSIDSSVGRVAARSRHSAQVRIPSIFFLFLFFFNIFICIL